MSAGSHGRRAGRCSPRGPKAGGRGGILRDARARRSATNTRSTCAAVRAVNVGKHATPTKLGQAATMARANHDVAEEAQVAGQPGGSQPARLHGAGGQRIRSVAADGRSGMRTDRYATMIDQLRLHADRAGRIRSRAGPASRSTRGIQRAAAPKLERAPPAEALGGLYMRMGDPAGAGDPACRHRAQIRRVGKRGVGARTLRVAGNASAVLGRTTRSRSTTCANRSSIDAKPHKVALTRVLIARNSAPRGICRRRSPSWCRRWTTEREWFGRERSAERARLRRAQANTAALADLRAADPQYAELGLEYDRIETNAAMSQALLALGDIAAVAAAADERDRS